MNISVIGKHVQNIGVIRTFVSLEGLDKFFSRRGSVARLTLETI